MLSQTIELYGDTPGCRHELQVLRFGTPGASPKAYVQAALHADEVPAMLVAQALRRRLEALEKAGQVPGEVVLVPFANPIGLAQQVMGQHHGRFDLRDGGNFNRAFADLSAKLAAAVDGRLTADSQGNTAVVRAALRDAAAALTARSSAEDLKIRLLQWAVDADVVLDLHCDSEAVVHLYGLTPQRDLACELGAALSAQAVLLATESGGSPFDEACTRPWLLLQQQRPDVPIALACFAATVELRGGSDVSHPLANADADALLAFLHMRGVLGGPAPVLPAAACEATPLSSSEPVLAPHAGVVVFHRQPGDRVAAGDTLADLVDPASGKVTAVRCESGGVLYARCRARWAYAGMRLAKIAGTTLQRDGALLSP